MVDKPEFYIFRNYSKGIKVWLEKTVYLSDYKSDKQPKVVFMTAEKAYAKMQSDIINGFPDTSYVSFILTDATEDPSQRPLGFLYENKIENDNLVKIRHPMVYSLQYTVNIFTRLMAESDIISYQILSNSFKNHAGVITVGNQWAEIYGERYTPTAEINNLTNEDRFIKTTLLLNVPRAYVPFPVEVIKGGIIKHIQIGTEYTYDYDSTTKEFVEVE